MSEPDARRVAYEVVRRTFEQDAYADRAFRTALPEIIEALGPAE